MADNDNQPDWKKWADQVWTDLRRKRPDINNPDEWSPFERAHNLTYETAQGTFYTDAELYIDHKLIRLEGQGDSIRAACEDLIEDVERKYFEEITGPRLGQEAIDNAVDDEHYHRTERGV